MKHTVTIDCDFCNKTIVRKTSNSKQNINTVEMACFLAATVAVYYSTTEKWKCHSCLQ